MTKEDIANNPLYFTYSSINSMVRVLSDALHNNNELAIDLMNFLKAHNIEFPTNELFKTRQIQISQRLINTDDRFIKLRTAFEEIQTENLL